MDPGMAFPDSDGFGRGLDSGGFRRIPSSAAGDSFAVFYSLCGDFDPTDMDSDSDGFGRGSDSDGFGRIHRPHHVRRDGLARSGRVRQFLHPRCSGAS